MFLVTTRFLEVVLCQCPSILLMFRWRSLCQTETAFQIDNIEEGDIIKAVKSLKNSTATGYDELRAFLLEPLSWAFVPALANILHMSINKSSYPNAWKKANVTCTWKQKGSKTDPANYRPISVLPVPARIFEKIIAYQVSTYCEEFQHNSDLSLIHISEPTRPY